MPMSPPSKGKVGIPTMPARSAQQWVAAAQLSSQGAAARISSNLSSNSAVSNSQAGAGVAPELLEPVASGASASAAPELLVLELLEPPELEPPELDDEELLELDEL